MSEGCAADKFLKFPSAPSSARCPKRSAGTQTAGRLFLAYLILAKQKKVSRPPRRQSGIGTLQRTRALMQREASTGSARSFDTSGRTGKSFDRLSPNGDGNGTGSGIREQVSEAGVFGVGAQIPCAFGLPFGCCASLRREIVIRPQKPGSADIALRHAAKL